MKAIAFESTRDFQRLSIAGDWGDEHNGAGLFRLPRGQFLLVQFSNGGAWEHVSVSRQDRPPTWGEMCAVKDFFFDKDEVVVQYHPAAAEYVNYHPNCLHMWRPTEVTLPTPPTWMVGPKADEL